MLSDFQDVPQAPPDAILGVTDAWRACADPKKLNLGVGAYRDERGRPLVLQVVREAEERLLADPAANHEYLPIGGIPEFCRASAQLAFGEGSAVVHEGRNATIQTLSGTGSLRVGAEFLAKFYRRSKVALIPNPTWANHRAIFERAGLEVRPYRYYKRESKGLDYEGLLADVRAAPEGAIFLLHACAHNPTGVDPTPEQWGGILDVVKECKVLPFFDSAYQGFATGDLDRDAAAIRLFAGAGLEILLAQSYAKNMGLYGERVGALSVVVADSSLREPVLSQLRLTARAMYSNPPKHGAAVAASVLGNPAIFARWREELKGMADRIISMRHKLRDDLVALEAPGNWDHIVIAIGMFSFLGLSPQQVQHLTDKFHIFLTKDGRISMAGLSGDSCKYLAEAINDAVRTVS